MTRTTPISRVLMLRCGGGAVAWSEPPVGLDTVLYFIDHFRVNFPLK